MFGLPPPPGIHNVRIGAVSQALIPKPNPFLLKARKNFDLSTDCIPLLSSGAYQKLSGKTIKLLFSKHAKKKSSVRMSLNSRNYAFSKVIARNVKSFSYYIPNLIIGNEKPNRKILKLTAYSYKHLEQLRVKNIDIQNKSSFASIAKMNHLQNLNMKLTTGKYFPSPKFFQSLKRLQHLTLSINEATISKETHIIALAEFLYGLRLLPSLESYDVEVCSTFSHQSESFVIIVLSLLKYLKAKQFLIQVQCSEDIDLRVANFSSLLENIGTLEYKYLRFGMNLNERFQFKAPTSKKLVLFLRPSEKNQSLAPLINTCTSLENLYFQQKTASPLLTAFKLPQTLKALALKVSRPQSPQTLEFWENAISSLNNLESLNLILNDSDAKVEEWASQLPKNVSLNSLKQYHLRLEGEIDLRPGVKVGYDSFLTEWSKGLQNLSTLETLSLVTSSILLKSLDFFTETIASLSKLKSIKLVIFLHNSKSEGMLEFAIPSQNLPSLEHIWLNLSPRASKDSAVKFLQDIANCKNLQSLRVSGLPVDEETAILILKELPSLKELQFEIPTRCILRLNSKKEVIKCPPLPFGRKF